MNEYKKLIEKYPVYAKDDPVKVADALYNKYGYGKRDGLSLDEFRYKSGAEFADVPDWIRSHYPRETISGWKKAGPYDFGSEISDPVIWLKAIPGVEFAVNDSILESMQRTDPEFGYYDRIRESMNDPSFRSRQAFIQQAQSPFFNPVKSLAVPVSPASVDDMEKYDKKVVDNFYNQLAERSVRDTTFWGKLAQQAPELVQFLGEMYLSGGSGTVGRKVVKEAISEGIEKVAKEGIEQGTKKWLLKRGVEELGGIAGAATGRTMVNPLHSMDNISQERLSNYLETGKTDDLKALKNGVLQTYFEFFGEESGSLLTKTGGTLFNKVRNHLPESFVRGIDNMRKVGDKVHANKMAKAMKHKLKVGGFVEEWAEEDFTNFLNAVAGSGDWSDVAGPYTDLEQAGLRGVTLGAMQAPAVAGTAVEDYAKLGDVRQYQKDIKPGFVPSVLKPGIEQAVREKQVDIDTIDNYAAELELDDDIFADSDAMIDALSERMFGKLEKQAQDEPVNHPVDDFAPDGLAESQADIDDSETFSVNWHKKAFPGAAASGNSAGGGFVYDIVENPSGGFVLNVNHEKGFKSFDGFSDLESAKKAAESVSFSDLAPSETDVSDRNDPYSDGPVRNLPVNGSDLPAVGSFAGGKVRGGYVHFSQSDSNINGWFVPVKKMLGKFKGRLKRVEIIDENGRKRTIEAVKASKQQIADAMGVSADQLIDGTAGIHRVGKPADQRKIDRDSSDQQLIDEVRALDPEKLSDITVSSPSNDDPSDVKLHRLSNMLGMRVVYFNGPGNINGISNQAKPGIVYVNRNSAAPALTTLGHELLHNIRQAADLDNSLRGELGGFLKSVLAAVGKDEFRRLAQDTSLANSDGSLSRESVEEVLADMLGSLMTQESFWRQLGERSPKIFKLWADYIIDLIKKLGLVIPKILDPLFAAKPQYHPKLLAQAAQLVHTWQSRAGGINDPGITGESLKYSESYPADFRSWQTQFANARKNNWYGQQLRLKHTPAVLQLLDADDLPMVLDGNKIDSIRLDHPDFDLNIIAKLPDLLSDPIAVFNSDPGSSAPGNSLVVLTEANDRQGKPVIAAIHLDVGKGYFHINRISSVYGRNNANKRISDWIGKGLLRYARDKKSLTSYAAGELQLLLAGYEGESESASDTNAIREGFYKRIQYKTDLVKFQQKNSLKYSQNISSDAEAASQRINLHINYAPDPVSVVERVSGAYTTARREFIDSLAPLEGLDRIEDNDYSERPSDSPSAVAAFLKQKDKARAAYFYEHGPTDLAGNRIAGVKSLAQILKPFKGDRRALAELNSYLLALRANKLHERGIETGLDPKDTKKTQQAYQHIYHGTAIEITRYANSVIDYLVESGAVSEAEAARYKRANPYYVPFYRYTGKPVGPTVKPKPSGYHDKNPVRKIEGGIRPIINPIESLIMQTEFFIARAHKAAVARAVGKKLTRYGDMPGFAEKIEPPKETFELGKSELIEQLKNNGIDITSENLDISDMLHFYGEIGRTNLLGPNIVSCVVNGKRSYYKLSDELYNVLSGLDHYILPAYLSILSLPARAVRLGATALNPEFGFIKNFIRDFISYYFLNKGSNPFDSLVGLAKDWGHRSGLKSNDTVERSRALGGDQSLSYLRQDMNKHRRSSGAKAERLTGTASKFKTVLNVADFLRQAFTQTEAGPRIAAFDRTLKDAEKLGYGKDSLDAAIMAFNAYQDATINFTRSGNSGKLINQFIPFFNAGIQGQSKLWRAFKSDPKGFTAKAVAFMTIPTLLLWYRNRDKDWYRKLDVHDRAAWWFFELGGDVYRIPKPFEFGYIFASLPEAVADDSYGSKQNVAAETLIHAITQSLPLEVRKTDDNNWVEAFVIGAVASPAWSGPIVDTMTNTDWTGRPIVPLRNQFKPKKDQVGYDTSEIITSLVNELNLDVSPAKVQHWIDSYSGGAFRRLSNYYNYVESAAAGEELQKSQIPVGGTIFARDPDRPRRQMTLFYRELKELDAKMDSREITSQEAYRLRRLKHANKTIKLINQRLRNTRSGSERKQLYERLDSIISRSLDLDT